MNVFETLRKEISEALDVNNDGLLNVKDLYGFFSKFGPVLAVLVIDLLALVAEVRVWDVGMQMTGSWLKALGFVAISAVPFYLGQLLWLYPRATIWQQLIAGLMVGTAIYTGVVFGLADLSRQIDMQATAQLVAWLTGGYMLALILYVLVDESIRANRMLTVTKAKVQEQLRQLDILNEALARMEEYVKKKQALEATFGKGTVDDGLKRLKGKRPEQPKKAQLPQVQPAREYPNWTVKNLLQALQMNEVDAIKLMRGLNPDQAYDALRTFGIEDIDISAQNLKDIVRELKARGGALPDMDPQLPARK